MNSDIQFEDRASSSRSKHEGESSYTLCDRLSRTRDISQRQLPTDHDYAVPTREYQIDQSSLKLAPTAARPVLERRNKQRQQQKQPHKCAAVDGVTPYQGSCVRNASTFPSDGETRFLIMTEGALLGRSRRVSRSQGFQKSDQGGTLLRTELIESPFGLARFTFMPFNCALQRQ
jgi:hypothetical protein